MEKLKKRCLEVNPNTKSFDAVEKVGGDKLKHMSDAKKSTYIAEADKRRVEYAKVMNFYHRLMAAEEEESDKSRSEVVASKDGENPCYAHLGDKSNAKSNYVFHTKKKSQGLRRLARDLDKPRAYFIFMEEFRKQFCEQNPSIKSIAAVAKAGGSKWKQMSDAEKAPYMAEEEKRKLEYAKRTNVYNRLVATEEEEYSDKSGSEFDDEEGSGEEDEDDNLYTFFFSS
ncbi:high mobility group B protein 3-like [Lycium barbarum]|uniref:high mobility group B protein 3-like n=1 Tax=Lycium barbarum TaxID=112863 RepID=UPI00293E4716|nr:high mobility group B protein 3-like [Lycium barbarum]XP_060188538.1 high mobility group B protein 3-like [Lycium barbarum]